MKSGIFILKNLQFLIRILRKLDECLSHERTLLGIEYLSFVQDNGLFECLLCPNRKSGNVRSIIGHFKSKMHCLEYLHKHFPNVYDSINKFRENVKLSGNEFYEFIRHLGKEINYRCSRENPTVLINEDIEKCREEILSQIYKNSKCKEKVTDSLCIDLIVKIQHLEKKFRKRIEADAVADDDRKRKIDWSINSRDPRLKKAILAKNDSNEESSEIRKANIRRVQNLSNSCDIITKYKHSYEKISQKIANDYAKYKNSPDKHPYYEKEWSYYCFEKTREYPKTNLYSKNFIDQWFSIWQKRLNELKIEELLIERVILRKELKLPLDPIDAVKFEDIKAIKIKHQEEIRNFETNVQTDCQSLKCGCKRKLLIDIDEINDDIQKKICTSNCVVEIADSPSLEVISTDETSSVDENKPEPIMTMDEILLLYSNYHMLTENIKDSLYAYMVDLKRKNSEMYSKIIEKDVFTVVNPEHSNLYISSESENEEDHDDTMLKNCSSKVCVTIPKSPHYKNVDCIDLTDS